MGESAGAGRQDPPSPPLADAAQPTHFEVIDGSDHLYRRLVPEAIENDGSVNSLAYRLRRGEDYLSVDLARLTTPEAVLAVRPDFGLGVISAADVPKLDLSVQHSPTPANPAHAKIEGQITKAKSRQMARATSVLHPPTAPKRHL